MSESEPKAKPAEVTLNEEQMETILRAVSSIMEERNIVTEQLEAKVVELTQQLCRIQDPLDALPNPLGGVAGGTERLAESNRQLSQRMDSLENPLRGVAGGTEQLAESNHRLSQRMDSLENMIGGLRSSIENLVYALERR